MPDLLMGLPGILTGRFVGNKPTTIRVSGLEGGVERTFSIDVNPTAAENQHPAIESLWARAKIEDLSYEETSNPSEQLHREITDISLEHHLLCKYTAFVAVDESERTAGEAVPVAIPVPTPKDVAYKPHMGAHAHQRAWGRDAARLAMETAAAVKTVIEDSLGGGG